jgi:hypothetical protein
MASALEIAGVIDLSSATLVISTHSKNDDHTFSRRETMFSKSSRLIARILLFTLVPMVTLQTALGQEPTSVKSQVIPSSELYLLLENLKGSGPDHPLVRRGKEQAKSKLEFERRYLQVLIDSMTDRQQKLTEERNQLEIAKSEILRSARNLETLEQLAQNCLVEGQRLEWEIAGEEVVALDESSAKLELTKMRSEELEMELKALRTKLAAETKTLESLRPLAGKTVSTVDMQVTENKVTELEARLASLQAMKADFDAAKDLETKNRTDSSLKLKGLITRKKVVEKQLAMLNLEIEQARAGRRIQQLIDSQADQRKAIQAKQLEVEHELLVNSTVGQILESLFSKPDSKPESETPTK